MCELTILMPCLNEAETLAICIRKARTFLEENGVDGEVLISDNGSTDGSQEIAIAEGARVVTTQIKGYGSALINGCRNAYGKYVIMGDADDSYDFINLMPFLTKLREGYELVMGNRFSGGIEKGAMPWSHRYIGNPVLSFVGRLFFKSSIKDFHCGLRGYNKESILKLNLHTTGMEYASEMVVMSELANLRITEVPTTLKKDGRSRAPHLRSLRDGWRHLKFLFMYSPRWLFLYPGIFLLAIGIIGSCFLLGGVVNFYTVNLGIHTLLFCMTFVIVGFSIIDMFLLVKIYAYNHDFFPRTGRIDINERLKGDYFIFIGILLVLIGIVLSVFAVIRWGKADFGDLIPENMMRLVIPATTAMAVGVEAFFSGFLLEILKIKEQ